ncbi:MAG: DUF423 domain-containing protein [Gammaproteobacteria bacterium]
MSSFQRYFGMAALCGFGGVAFGAFGAHALRHTLQPAAIAIYKTGVEYQMWHALALGLVAVLIRSDERSLLLLWAARLMFSGIIFFSGSLYLLSTTGMRGFGLITPFGGVSFLVAWLLLVIYCYQSLGKIRDA